MILRAALFERFFGRVAEVDALLGAFREVTHEQSARMLIVSGEAGIGKSRLLAEFGGRVARERGHVIAAACLEYARTPYGPFVEAFANEPLAWKAVDALREPGKPEASSDDDKLRRFALVDQFLRRVIATRGATVLLVEDAHWSDSATLELFGYLGRRLGDVPALLVATVRSDELESSPRLASTVAQLVRDGASELRLGPLSNDLVAEAIRVSMPPGHALPDAAIERICELSEGRPLIAEELMRGALGEARSRGELDPRAVFSVRASIVGRMQDFSDAERLMLTYAAVIGRDFDSALLARIVARPVDVVLHVLRQARNAQLVKQVGEDRFTFRHALTREVLYRELLTGEARALHATIATVLEADDARADEVAYHWWAARDAARATVWNERVGDRAAAMYAFADAAVRYERALRFADRGSALRASLLEKATSALVTIGEMERARALCQEAAGERRAQGNDDAALRLMLWVARQWYEAGSAPDALATLQSVRDQLGERPGSPLAYTAATSYAAMLALQGKPEEALAVLDSTANVPSGHDPIDDFRALNSRGIACAALGEYAGALDSYGAASEVAERLGNVDLLLHSRNNIADVFARTGSTDRALAVYQAGLALADEHGHRRMKALFSVSVAHCMLSLGRLGEARAILQEDVESRSAATAAKLWSRALALRLHTLAGDRAEDCDALDAALRVGEPMLVALAAGALAQDALACGGTELARAAIERGLFGLPSFEYGYWLLDAVARAGDDRAVAFARDLFVIAVARRNPLGIAHGSLFEARVALRRGNPEGAREHARRAHEAFVSLRLPVESAEALETAGDLEGALTVLREIGATSAAQRIEESLGRRRTAAVPARTLTGREVQIARLLARGYSSRVVATELGIGARTVETHVAAIYRKLGIKSRAELALRIAAEPAAPT